MTGDEPRDPSTDAAPTEAAPDVATDPRRWREVLAEGRFETASRLRLIAVGEGVDEDDGDEAAAVRALAEVQGLLRDKAWVRARRRYDQLEARPPLVPWEALEAALERLEAAGPALDRREVEVALDTLGGDAPALLEAEWRTQLGTAKVLDDAPTEAQDAFERALELDPRHYRAMVNLGNVALEEGRVDDAIALYRRALDVNDDFPNAHHNLGVAYRRKGEIAKSVRALRRAQKADRVRETAEARATIKKAGGGLGGRRARWLAWGAVAAVVVWFLMTRG